jgi:hypothetical protein
MAMTDDCRVPLFRHEREHHILVGAPDSLLGVGRDSHVQLGGGGPLHSLGCTVRYAMIA